MQLWALLALQIAQASLNIGHPERMKEGTIVALDESPYDMVRNSEIQRDAKLNEARNVRRYNLLSNTLSGVVDQLDRIQKSLVSLEPGSTPVASASRPVTKPVVSASKPPGSVLDELHQADARGDKRIELLFSYPNITMAQARYAQELDGFLAKHKWWVLLSEPQSWQAEKVVGGKPTGTYRPLILQRIDQVSENYMRATTEWQFPDEQACHTRPMALDVSGGSGWGSAADMRQRAIPTSSLVGAIYEVYQKTWDNDGPQVPSHAIGWTLVGTDDCPDDNKWYCLFLPSTNCSVPSKVMNANKKEDFLGDAAVIPNLGYLPAFYTTSDAGGEFMGMHAKLTTHQWGSGVKRPWHFEGANGEGYKGASLFDVNRKETRKFTHDNDQYMFWFLQRFSAKV
jgi:hypothetical protein